MAEETKRSFLNYKQRKLLDNAVRPYIRDFEDETFEFIDPSMTYHDLMEKIAGDIPFPVTENNVSGICRDVFGLQRRPESASRGSEVRISTLEARLAEAESVIAADRQLIQEMTRKLRDVESGFKSLIDVLRKADETPQDFRLRLAEKFKVMQQ